MPRRLIPSRCARRHLQPSFCNYSLPTASMVDSHWQRCCLSSWAMCHSITSPSVLTLLALVSAQLCLPDNACECLSCNGSGRCCQALKPVSPARLHKGSL